MNAFITRVSKTTIDSAHPYCVQRFTGDHAKNVKHDDLWEIIFAGTEAECQLFTINAHHAIDPNMANATVVSNPKRIIEP